ncbi:glycosyltransferase family 2 protein [Galbibacter sp. EGI 63066]|uniref:glycosyltransferase family 2 protein n=1 Tax=Galbibacter sp. EGI 63066 TaxID=2993559 RepID=UPI00224956AA|nr:glycosyltransferase family 2 protein [Galbibacter sp. EGI 63066]MCX2680812.1 glycosyltransferase family 2 protein [Galbibacter sp. EGI 63066]
MKIAVVILNWNGKDLLEKFLPSVIKFSPDANIYVVDNASTDHSVDFVKEHYPTVQIIQNEVNGGFAKGYNDALKNIEEDVFCLLNSDIEVTKDWLTPIEDTFKKNREIAIIQPKILDYKDKTSFEYAGAAGGYIDRLGYPFCRGRVFQTMEKDQGQYDDIKEIFWATGACMFIKKEVFNALGGFDEDYFAHQEEIDLCWRAQNRGYKIVYTGASKVYHVGGATLNNMNPKKTFLNFRNSLFSITKNLPLRKVIPLIVARLFLDGIAGIRFLFQLKFLHLLAIIKAHFSYYYYFVKIINKRGQIKDLKYFSCSSVVVDYFIKQKRYYREIVKE